VHPPSGDAEISRICQPVGDEIQVNCRLNFSAMENHCLIERICQRRKTTPAAAAEWLLYQTIPWSRRLVVRLIRLFSSGAFAHDRHVIGEASRALSVSEVSDAVNLLRRAPNHEQTFLREFVGCRVSGRRLLSIAQDFFDQA